MADFNTVGTEFAKYYYALFDNRQTRPTLGDLYRDISMLTWEGEPKLGKESIVAKLQGLGFDTVIHHVTTTDVQPTMDGKIFVCVTGLLQIDGDSHQLPFVQMFHLVPDGQSYYVLNDIFRLNLGG